MTFLPRILQINTSLARCEMNKVEVEVFRIKNRIFNYSAISF